MAFYVGQLVECVNPNPVWRQPGPYGERFPEGGRIYTVREVCHFGGREALLLEEIRNPAHDYAEGRFEGLWRASRFRPLTDARIAVFRRLLAPSPKQTEDA